MREKTTPLACRNDTTGFMMLDEYLGKKQTYLFGEDDFLMMHIIDEHPHYLYQSIIVVAYLLSKNQTLCFALSFVNALFKPT